MNLLETITSYYQGEARHGFWAAITGGLLLIGGLIILKWPSSLSLLKGLSIPMLLFGLLVGIGGGVDSIYASKTRHGKIALYQKDPADFLKEEKLKVEKTHQGWHGIRIFWAMIGLMGLALSLLIRKPFWTGAGLGTVGLAIIISLFELYSMRFNERYYQIIQFASTQQTNINIEETRTYAQQQIRRLQTTIEPQVRKQKRAKIMSDILSPQVLPFGCLKNLSALNIADLEIIDTANFVIPKGLQPAALTNETASVSYINKKSEVPDYYNADPIQTKIVAPKHCWFGKTYNKE